MSRPRRYRVVQLAPDRWALQGECVWAECGATNEWRWGACGHWELLPYRWPRHVDAERQRRLWTARQQLLLDATVKPQVAA